jgi:hypothetical protein
MQQKYGKNKTCHIYTSASDIFLAYAMHKNYVSLPV